MAQICKVCNHPKRLEIDKEIVSGKSKTTIARKYGVSTDSVTNHAQKHLSRQLVQAHERKDLLESILNMQRLERSFTIVEEIMQRNYREGKDMLALAANREVRGFFELLCRISDTLLEVRRLEFEQSRPLEESNPQLHKIVMWDKIKEANLTELEIAVLGKLGCLDSGGDAGQFQEIIDSYLKPSFTPLPSPIIPHKNDYKADLSDVPKEPEDNLPLRRPHPVNDEPKPLPPRPVQLIPCSTRDEQRQFAKELRSGKARPWKPK